MYLEQTDIEKGIYPEILQVIARNPDNITNAIREAMAEVASYLQSRFNIADEFLKTGESRNTLVMRLVREVALYNCYTMSNPVNMPESRIERYKGTISFL